MTTSGSITLKGLEDYLEKVAQAGADVNEAAARAVFEGAEVALDGMQRRVPVLTGNLRDHLAIKGPEMDGNYITCEVGILKERSYTDEDTARYANVIEYGAAHTAAQPYIRPTLQGDAARIRAAMKESLTRDGVI